MKIVTVNQFLDFKPCWDDERIRAFAGNKWTWTALDVLKSDGVSDVDKLWAVLREEFIDAEILHEFACQCAARALSKIENPDPRSIRAVEVKRKWMRGEATDKELDAAWAAAWDAARAAARDAARDAAMDRERTWQVQKLIELLEEAEKGEPHE